MELKLLTGNLQVGIILTLKWLHLEAAKGAKSTLLEVGLECWDSFRMVLQPVQEL